MGFIQRASSYVRRHIIKPRESKQVIMTKADFERMQKEQKEKEEAAKTKQP